MQVVLVTSLLVAGGSQIVLIVMAVLAVNWLRMKWLDNPPRVDWPTIRSTKSYFRPVLRCCLWCRVLFGYLIHSTIPGGIGLQIGGEDGQAELDGLAHLQPDWGQIEGAAGEVKI